jgi:hypothetical protein
LIARRCVAAASGAFILLLLAAQPALATFHEMAIREVYPGSVARPNSAYVELQMWSPGQNLVGGHQISVYNKSGSPVGTAAFAHDVAGDANQSTLVVATPEAEAEFGLGADAALPSGLLDPAGGAVCWESLDCASWGSFSGSTPSPTGSPASPGGIPDGMALRRTIEPGCPTLLEPGDDRDNSAADFTAVFPGPRPNSVSPSEHACSLQAAAGGGNAYPGSGATGAVKKHPQTQIRQGPGHSTRDRTPTFRFTSSVSGSTYLCKLDGGSFKRCHSPFTTPRLRVGRHVLKVKARVPGGAGDPSPASYGFTLAKPRHARHRQSA